MSCIQDRTPYTVADAVVPAEMTHAMPVPMLSSSGLRPRAMNEIKGGGEMTLYANQPANQNPRDGGCADEGGNHVLLPLPEPEPEPEGLAVSVSLNARADRITTHVARRPGVRAGAARAGARGIGAGVAGRAGARAGTAAIRVENNAGLENAKGRRVLQEGVPVGLVRGR